MAEKKLRPYQEALIDNVRAAFSAGHQSVCLQLPTGGGKTLTVSTMIKRALTKGNKSGIIAHRRELVEQISRTLNDMDVPHGLIAAGSYHNFLKPVQVCSVQTLANRLDKIKSARLIVFDECHHTPASTWVKVYKFIRENGGKIIGLTATPERLDGKGLNDFFDIMVQGPTVEDLINQGYLSPYKVFAPSNVNLNGVHTRMGDFARDEIEDIMDKPSITGDIVKHYLKYALGKKGLIFAVSIQHSKHIVESFRANGITAEHVDGSTPSAERTRITKAFECGEILLMSNVDLFGEGYDVPSAEVAILARPTKSVSLHLQQCGRVLRPIYKSGMPLNTDEERVAAIAAGDKKFAIILDHVGNCLRLGLPDEDRKWSLQGREQKRSGKKDEVKITTRQCPQCYYVQAAKFGECQSCGHVFEIASRKLEEVDGELVELTKEQQRELAIKRRREMAKEQSSARTLESLIKLGISRGYKQPEAWARYVMKARANG